MSTPAAARTVCAARTARATRSACATGSARATRSACATGASIAAGGTRAGSRSRLSGEPPERVAELLDRGVDPIPDVLEGIPYCVTGIRCLRRRLDLVAVGQIGCSVGAGCSVGGIGCSVGGLVVLGGAVAGARCRLGCLVFASRRLIVGVPLSQRLLDSPRPNPMRVGRRRRVAVHRLLAPPRALRRPPLRPCGPR